MLNIVPKNQRAGILSVLLVASLAVQPTQRLFATSEPSKCSRILQELSRRKFLYLVAGSGVLGGATVLWRTWPHEKESFDQQVRKYLTSTTAGEPFTVLGLDPKIRAGARIILVPEYHDCPQCRELKSDYEKRPNTITSDEGDVYRKTDLRWGSVGLEEHVSHSVNIIIAHLHHYSKGNAASMSGETKQWLVETRMQKFAHPLAKTLWKQEVRAKVLQSRDKVEGIDDVVDYLDYFVDNVHNSLQAKIAINKNLKQLIADTDTFKIVDQKMAEALLGYLREHKKEYPIDLGYLTELVSQPDKIDDSKYAKFMAKYNLEWRERYLTQNVANAFVDSEPKKDVAVKIGLAHLERVYTLLRRSLDMSGGREIEIVIDDSHLDHKQDPKDRADQFPGLSQFLSSVPKYRLR